MNATIDKVFTPKKANISKRKKTTTKIIRQSKKRRQNNEDALFHILEPSRQDYYDIQAIIEAARLSPNASKRIYEFTFNGERCRCYPLHQAIKIGATCDVLDVLYTSFPPALEERPIPWGDTALHIAITHRSTPEVISFILEKWPDALKVRNEDMNQPLHDAILSKAPLEVISLLVHKWPGGINEEGEFSATPLHLACGRNDSFQLVALLADTCPDAAKKKDECGMTPLHLLCENNASSEYIFCLLEKWPEAVKEEDECGETPLLIAKRRKASDSIQKVLSLVDHLCGNEVDASVANDAKNFFIEIGWHRGVAFVLARYPAILYTLKVSTKEFPSFLSFVGRSCNVTLVWDIVSNNQELFADV